MVDRVLETYPPNGTFEDILSILARAEERRCLRGGASPVFKRGRAKLVLEPFFNAVGVAASLVGQALPVSFLKGPQDRCFSVFAGNSRHPFDPDAPGLEEARRMAAAVERRCGAPPGLLALMSHPPAAPEWVGLYVEMARHILLALRHVRGRDCRPRVVAAVDPFALNMLATAQEGMYAGFMGTYHLGFDRLAHHRSWASRLLLGRARWEHLPWRVAETLSHGGEAGLVLAGGVPTTARMLYTVREFLTRVRGKREAACRPAQVLERLLAGDRDFAGFFDSSLIGASLRRSAWRMIEAWIAARMVGEWPSGSVPSLSDVDAGRMTQDILAVLRSVARAMGIGAPALEGELAGLQEEFSRETPYRERFFRFLAGRILAKFKPVLLLPFVHRVQEGGERSLRLVWGQPVLLSDYRDGRLSVRGAWRAAGNGVPQEESVSVRDFAREFVRFHYQ